MATTSSATSAIFNGNSRYSSDFAAVITRATAIASLPITQLKADKTELSDQATELTTIGDKFSAIQTAVDGISQAMGGSSFQSEISDSSKLSVTLGDGAMEGNYSIEVLDAGAYATSMSTAAWAADAGTVHAYQLSLSGVNHALTVADNSVGSIAAAINSQYGDQVRATVVNVGTSATPDYRLSLQASQLGDLKPDVIYNGASRQTQQTEGALAQYVVNGSGSIVTSTTRSVTIANGITANLKASAPGVPVNISVMRSTSALSDALGKFATAYNDAVDEVDKQHGNQNGALAGQSLVGDLSQVLSRMSTYTDSGRIGGLGNLGMDLDKTGHLTFNPLKLLATDLTNSSGVDAFLGSTGTGGFLKTLSDGLNSVQANGTGLLTNAQAGLQTQMTGIDSTIADAQTRVDNMTARLQQQMAAADSLIASMEQQYNYIYGLFQAQSTADQQYK
jgi:flagellar hook-associated protein 2